MSEKLDKVKERILDKKIKVVSFDIFDTLLVRPACSPTDLFKIVGIRSGIDKRKFQMMRIYAEEEARKNKPFNIDDITLNDIYHQLVKKFGFTMNEAERVKKTELEVEEQYLYRRQSVGRLFEEAKNAGKEVIIISDMYLPKLFLEHVLKKNGYDGYRRLYLSCEYKVAKGSGKLFQYVADDYEKQGIKAYEIIHVGDNLQADIRQAEKYGMQAVHIPSAISVFKSKREFGRLINTMHPATDHTFLIGYLANYMFDDGFLPFNVGSIINGEVENLGYVTAPLFLAFTKWFLQETRDRNVDTVVLAYRDGYLIEKIIDIFQKYIEVPAIKRVYLSRKVRMDYLLSENGGLLNNVIDIPPNPSMTVGQFINTRMAIREEENEKKVLDIFLENGYTSRQNKLGSINCYINFLNKLEPFTGDYTVKNTINTYCKEMLESSKRIAVFDVGYRGSISRFLQDKLNLPNLGYHLLASSLVDTNEPDKYNLKSYIYYGMSVPRETVILHALIEDILCAQEGSVYGIRYQNDKLQLLRENYHEQRCIKEIQERIINYAEGFLRLFQQDIWKMEFDHYLEFELLFRLLTSPFKLDAAAIGKLWFYDSGFIAKTDNMYQEWSNKFYPAVNSTVSVVKIIGKREMAIKALDKIHLKPLALKMYHFIKRCYKYSEKWSIRHSFGWDSMLQEMENSIHNILTQEMLINKKNIIVAGDMDLFDKGICRYLNMLSERLHQKGYNMVLLSEAVLAPEDVLKKRISFSAFRVPTMLGKNYYKKYCKIDTPQDVRDLTGSSGYLSWAVANWTMRHSDMDVSYAQMLAGIAEIYYNQVFDYLKPCKIIMWNQFHALHHIINGIAAKRNIPVFYMEFGSIPGTFAFESMGQMGESYPAVKCQEFAKQPVTDKELQEAGDIWNYLKRSKLNRNIQSSSDHAKRVLNTLDKDKPIIFFAGQNDFESGLCPYDEHTKKYHSPVFKSSYEAMVYLAGLAKKNDWTFIYKPHPIVNALGSETKKTPSNVITLTDIDINEVIDAADVTVTILSQTGYISAIRKKATVMLGYTQLKGKGCTYEAFHEEQIEGVLKEAIKNGFRDEQEKAFQKHIAQMMKYYLFDDHSDKQLHYGQSIDKMVEILRKNAMKKGDMDNE